MSDFFKGWRRKVGCLLLVMALAAMGDWVRSIFVYDVLTVTPLLHTIEFVTTNGRVSLCIWNNSDCPLGVPFWMSGDIAPERRNNKNPSWAATLLRKRTIHHWTGSVSHWSLTLPLALISGDLILWKPRESSPNFTPPDGA